MIKQMIHRGQWLAAVLALLFMTVGCVDDTYQSCNQGVIDENGMVTLTIRADVPGLKVTRSVDINGEQIATLWVLAFNESGNMISRVLATDLTHTDPGTGNNGGAGTFTAKVPGSTRVLHFLANVNMDNFSDQDNIGRHENEVIAPLVSSSGNLVYWGRKEFEGEQALEDFATNPTTGVVLYRNQALLKYEVQPAQGVRSLEVDGWAICNQYAYGTVAPFDASAIGVDGDTPFHFDLINYDFVTELPEAYNVRMTDDEDVAQATATAGGDPRYVFDNPNTEDDQLYMIMKIRKNGGEAKYYKVLLVNDDKEPYKVIRNHLYTVTVKDVNESYGVSTFAEAKNATPVNNPWITISDEIPEVSNGDITLRIEGQTTVISQKEGDLVIPFYYNGTTAPIVEWTSNDGVSDDDPVVAWTPGTPEGTITLHMNAPVSGQITYGTIQIKESDGPLSRRVKVLSTEPFEFTPVWVSSEIPLLDNENIAVLFYIPDDFPQELLPIDVKFGCDLIDAQQGTELKVITEKNEYNIPYYNSETGQWESESITTDWNYKYVYSAETTGRHRVEFRTILTNLPTNVDKEEEFHIYMEGDDSRSGEDLFRQRDLFFAFQPRGTARRIMLDEGDRDKNYASCTIADLNPVSGETISIPFTLTLQGGQQSVDSEIWVYYDPELVKPEWTEGDAQTDYFGNTYVVYNATSAKNTVTFTTVSPNFDNSEIVFSAKSTDGYGEYNPNTADHDLGVNTRENSFRSAAVTIRSTGRLEFAPEWSLNGSGFTDATQAFNVPYGIEEEVYLRISIPQQVRGKEFEVNLETEYLTPVDGSWTKWPSAQGNGYTCTVNTQESTQVFHFRTNRLVSAETLTLSAGNTVGFDPVTMEIRNSSLTGTIQLPEGVDFRINDPYIVLERVSDGARIGTFTLPTNLAGQNSTTYTLTLRGEYNLNETDRVTVKWAPVEGPEYGTTYIHSCMLRDIMDNGSILLEPQQ